MEPITLQVGVKILLKNAQGQYLLLRRSLSKYPDVNGRWDIPGGRINPGTVLFDNLKREVKEETNVDLVGQPQLVAAQDILRSPGKHVVRLTYVGQAEGEIKLDPDEHDDHKWHSVQELAEHEDLDMYLKELLANKILTV